MYLSRRTHTSYCDWFLSGWEWLCLSRQPKAPTSGQKASFSQLEDIRYEMISELDYVARFVDSTINLSMSNKQLSFRSYNGARLRELCALCKIR